MGGQSGKTGQDQLSHLYNKGAEPEIFSPVPSTLQFAQNDGPTSLLLSCSDTALFSDRQEEAVPPRLDEKLSPQASTVSTLNERLGEKEENSVRNSSS